MVNELVSNVEHKNPDTKKKERNRSNRGERETEDADSSIVVDLCTILFFSVAEQKKKEDREKARRKKTEENKEEEAEENNRVISVNIHGRVWHAHP